MKKLSIPTLLALVALAPAVQASSAVTASINEARLLGNVLLVDVSVVAENQPACADSRFEYRVTERNQVRLVLDSVNTRALVFKGNGTCSGGSELLQYVNTVPPPS